MPAKFGPKPPWRSGPNIWGRLSVREAQLFAMLRREPMTQRQMADQLEACRPHGYDRADEGEDYARTVIIMMHRMRAKGVEFDQRCGRYWGLSSKHDHELYAFSLDTEA